MDDKPQLNLFNEIIEECSCEPLTGFLEQVVVILLIKTWVVILFVP